MTNGQLMQFTTHIEGRQADVKILPSCVQWTVRGRQQVVQILPVAAISSVETKRALAGRSTLTLFSKVGTIGLRVQKAIADQAQSVLTELLAQQTVSPLDDSPVPQRGSIADELNALKWLRDAGVLTDIEYDEESAQLLGLLRVTRKPG